MPRSSMFSFLAAGGKLFALEPSVHALPDPCDSDHKMPSRTAAVTARMSSRQAVQHCTRGD